MASRTLLTSSSYECRHVNRRLRLLRDCERHQQTDHTVDVTDRALLARLAIGGGIQLDRDVRHLPAQDRMPAMMNFPVEHRSLEQLNGRTHADKALAVFFERQP